MMFGRRRKKRDKKRAEWDAAASLLEAPDTAPDVFTPPAPPPLAPEPTPELAVSLAAESAPSTTPEPAPPLPPVPEPTPAAGSPAAATTGVPAPAEPPPVRYFADDTLTPVLSFSPVGAGSGGEHATTAVTEPSDRSSQPAPLSAGGPRTVALPEANRAFAERMRASQQEMAQLSMHMDAWMDQAAELRTELLVEWDADGLRPSYTDFVVRAVARSLVLHPYLNGVLREGAIELHADIHVGITTSTDDDVPLHVVSDADQRALKEITAESHRIEAEHESLRLALNEPTFVVSSLGAYGVDSFTPIVMAPNVATLGMGRVRDETRWEGDRPGRSSVMTLVLAWDHRAFGGATAAEFLVEVREMLEQPYRLLVD
jgi:pyruvate dehydrogenase E2 component (dihydrolipoamide acetyltransferase)